VSRERRTARGVSWTLLVGLGIAAFGLALFPGVAGRLPIDSAVELAGNDYFLLGVFGGVAIAVLIWMLSRRAREQVVQATPPDPETVPDAPRPGARFDELLGQWPGTLSEADRQRLFERLRADAVRAEMQAGASRERAIERIEAGEWTDDPVAARFLRGPESKPSASGRLRLALTGDSWTQYGARATARELVDRGETQ